MINTVSGKIAPQDLGVTCFFDSLQEPAPGINAFITLSESANLAEFGGNLDVNIITSNGRPDMHGTEDKPYRDIAKSIISEIREGIGNSGIYPGIISIPGSENDTLTDSEAKLFKAAAFAHRKTGLSVFVRAGTVKHAKFLINHCVHGDKLIILKADLSTDLPSLIKLLSLGVNIAAGIAGNSQAEKLKQLITNGYGEHILAWSNGSRCPNELFRKHGISDASAEKILIQNPARILRVDPNYKASFASFNTRLSILIDSEIICPRTAVLTKHFMSALSKKQRFSKDSDAFYDFETLVALNLEMIVTGDGNNDDGGLNDTSDLTGKWYLEFSKKTLRELCIVENLRYRDADAEVLAGNIGEFLSFLDI